MASSKYSPEDVKRAHEILYSEGIKMRYQVAGKEYVDKSLAAANNPFAKAMQEVRHNLLVAAFLAYLLILDISTSRNPAGAASGRARAWNSRHDHS